MSSNIDAFTSRQPGASSHSSTLRCFHVMGWLEREKSIYLFIYLLYLSFFYLLYLSWVDIEWLLSVEWSAASEGYCLWWVQCCVVCSAVERWRRRLSSAPCHDCHSQVQVSIIRPLCLATTTTQSSPPSLCSASSASETAAQHRAASVEA